MLFGMLCQLASTIAVHKSQQLASLSQLTSDGGGNGRCSLFRHSVMPTQGFHYRNTDINSLRFQGQASGLANVSYRQPGAWSTSTCSQHQLLTLAVGSIDYRDISNVGTEVMSRYVNVAHLCFIVNSYWQGNTRYKPITNREQRCPQQNAI